MNCAYHPDRMVQGVCSTCGRPICDTCLVELGGHVYCKPCLEVKVRKPARDVNGFTRFVLSVVPGLGHLYMGLFQRGMQFLLGTVVGSIIIGNLYAPFLGIIIPVMVFFSIFDAREAHLRLNQGLEVQDRGFVDMDQVRAKWQPRHWGYVLIGAGALIMFNGIVNDLVSVVVRDWMMRAALSNALRGMMVGALAIAAGVWLLRRSSTN